MTQPALACKLPSLVAPFARTDCSLAQTNCSFAWIDWDPWCCAPRVSSRLGGPLLLSWPSLLPCPGPLLPCLSPLLPALVRYPGPSGELWDSLKFGFWDLELNSSSQYSYTSFVKITPFHNSF